MQQRVSLITLGVSNLARSLAFYQQLGWSCGTGSSDGVVFFQAGGLVVALWGRSQLAEDSGVIDSGGYGGITLAHNVRSPEEVDRIVAEARAAGARVTREPAEIFWGGYSSSPILTAIPGRSPTTHTGLCMGMGR